jgi:hypothetical protein
MDICKFEDKINETHKILTGNGNPEEGICRQVALINERQQGVLTELKEINANYNVLLKEITQVGTKVATIEGKIIGREVTIKSIVKNGLIIIGFIITIGVAVWTKADVKNNGKKVEAVQDTLKTEIRMQEGISKVTRGGFVKYNDAGLSDSIKIWK